MPSWLREKNNQLQSFSISMLKSILIFAGASLMMLAPSAQGIVLPDNRVYEMVTPLEKNGVDPGVAVSAPTGETIDWYGTGGLGQATSAGVNLYQSLRTVGGWQTVALTPRPPVPLGFLQEQAPMFWTPDLSKTIYTTPGSYDAGDADTGALDLYLQLPDGSLSWISQGTQGGNAPDEVTFDGSTPGAEHVVFSTEESLVPQAVGIQSSGYRATEYLYQRNVAAKQTMLVNVDNSGKLLNSEGAILGDGNWLTKEELPAESFLPANVLGTTTNAISSDGSKVFFESPPPSSNEADLKSYFQQSVHLYMRDNGETIPIDNPAITKGPGARYEGASEDGSLVFFSSEEALGGNLYADKGLYEFDTQSRIVTPISASEDGADGHLVGVTAIANDGSHVYFVAKGILASNSNAKSQSAVEGAPNFYVYDTSRHSTTFIATLSLTDAEPETERPGPLTVEPDYERLAVPTPNGSVLVFDSSADLTGQNSSGYFELYRYQADDGALTCISCTPVGVTPTGSAAMGGVGGGSYGLQGHPLAMSADGSRIFFDSPDPLVSGDINTRVSPSPGKSTDVYEWENGQVSLISDGRSSLSSLLDGTTPSGNDVFFTTAASLVPQDTDGSFFDIYDARVYGGFPAPTAPSTPCSGTSCRGPIGPAPSFGTPGSTLLQGAISQVLSAKPKAKQKAKPGRSHRHKQKKKHVRKAGNRRQPAHGDKTIR